MANSETQGENIRLERIKKGISQEYLAIKLDISQAAFSKIERGKTKVKVEMLVKIAELLDVPVHALITTKQGMPINFFGLRLLFAQVKSKVQRLLFGRLKGKKTKETSGPVRLP